MAPIQKKYTKQQLANWFTEKIKSTNEYKEIMRNLVLNDVRRQKNQTVLGKMYIYEYDAKHKDTLPIWDRYPLVFPIEPYPDGFLGLNIHYLKLDQRKKFLAILEDYLHNKKYVKSTRLKLTYEMLQRSKKLSTFGNPCIKRYLFTHIKSHFIEIPTIEWEMAAELPIELWVKKK